MADDEGWERERGVRSKDLIKTHHGMSYCDSRDQDRGVCVCSLQLWIISTLFLLWPTCTERRIWEYAHMSAGLSGLFSPWGCRRGWLVMVVVVVVVGGCSPYGKPYVNFNLSVSAGDNHGPAAGCTHWTADAPSPSCCAFTECWRFTSDPRLPSVFSSWRRFLWSPWMTPISTLLHSLWNQFSLFCSYSVWVTMDTAPKWFGLHMNLFMSVTWSGLECSFFFFVQPK